MHRVLTPYIPYKVDAVTTYKSFSAFNKVKGKTLAFKAIWNPAPSFQVSLSSLRDMRTTLLL